MQILIVTRILIIRARRTQILLHRFTFCVIHPSALTKGAHDGVVVARLGWNLLHVNISQQKLSFHFLTRPGADDTRHYEHCCISALNLIQVIFDESFANLRVCAKLLKCSHIIKSNVALKWLLINKSINYV